MKFTNINERKPKQGQIVLIKTKEEDSMKYCVCIYSIKENTGLFEEYTQSVMYWHEDEIQGWTPIEDIEKPEASCSNCMFSLKDYRGVTKVCQQIDRGEMFEEDPYTPMAICSFYKEVKQ